MITEKEIIEEAKIASKSWYETNTMGRYFIDDNNVNKVYVYKYIGTGFGDVEWRVKFETGQEPIVDMYREEILSIIDKEAKEEIYDGKIESIYKKLK